MKIEFSFIRHAETVANRDNILQGHCDYPLTDTGILDTINVGLSLSSVFYKLAYSSDLNRAITTANIILSKLEIKPDLKMSSLIRELNFGIREKLPRGTSTAEAKQIISRRDSIPIIDIIDNAENGESVFARQQIFIETVFNDYEIYLSPEVVGKNDEIPKILVLSHGGFIKRFLSSFCGLRSIDKIKNCSVSKVVIEKIIQDDGKSNFKFYADESSVNIMYI